jgi:hypothetical protein
MALMKDWIMAEISRDSWSIAGVFSITRMLREV